MHTQDLIYGANITINRQFYGFNLCFLQTQKTFAGLKTKYNKPFKMHFCVYNFSILTSNNGKILLFYGILRVIYPHSSRKMKNFLS